MKKHKSFCLFLCGLFCCFPLSGCGNRAKDTIIVAMPMGDERVVWEAIEKDYERLNPNVDVQIVDKESEGYQSWLINSFNAYPNRSDELPADIVTVNLFQSYLNDGKFVSLEPYLRKITPYGTDENGEAVRWMDTLEKAAYLNSLDNKFIGDGECYCISLDEAYVSVFYNKRIFEDCKVEVPKTWDEFVAVCKTISENKHPETGNNFYPLSIPGNSYAMSYYLNWILRIYSDQYFRDLEPTLLMQEGDYYYDEESTWRFDPLDPNNENHEDCSFNAVRLAAQVYNGEDVSVLSGRYAEMLENLAEVFPTYALPDWFSSEMGYENYYFFNAESAMILATSEFTTSFDYMMSRRYQKGYRKFDYGVFQLPPMGVDYDEENGFVKREGSLIGSTYTRSVGGATGYVGIVNKSKRKNDLNADFLMYYASKQGQGVRVQAIEKNQLNVSGNILVKGFELEEKIADQLSRVPSNGVCDFNPAVTFCMGWMGDDVSIRDTKAALKEFFAKEKTVEECTGEIHSVLKTAIDKWIKNNNYKSDCLSYPQKNPSIHG